MKSHWLLPLVALACTAEPPDDSSSSNPPAATSPAPTVPGPVLDTGTSEVDEPAPYIVEEDDLPDVTVDLAEAEAALQDAIDLALTVHALPVESSYNAAMSTQGSQCPYYYTTADGTYWFDNCTAESGAEFNGYVFAYGESGVSDGYGGTFDYWQAFGAATVVDPSGHLLEMGGQAYHTTGYGFGFTTYTSVVQGTFAFDGPEGDGTWMGEGVDPDFILYGYRAGEGDDAARPRQPGEACLRLGAHQPCPLPLLRRDRRPRDQAARHGEGHARVLGVDPVCEGRPGFMRLDRALGAAPDGEALRRQQVLLDRVGQGLQPVERRRQRVRHVRVGEAERVDGDDEAGEDEWRRRFAEHGFGDAGEGPGVAGEPAGRVG